MKGLNVDNFKTDMLDSMDAAEVAQLPPAALNDLHWMVSQEIVTARQREARLHEAFERRWAAKAAQARLSAGKDTGSVHLEDDGFDVTVNAPKKVKWDQPQLKKILDTLDPDTARHFAKVSIAVEERKFDAATPDLRALLATARTVETGKTTYALSPLQERAA